jgi:hypothetical protein
VSVDSTCEAKARAWVADYARHEVFPHHPLHGALALALAVELGSMKATIIAAVAAIYGEHASGPVAIPLRGRCGVSCQFDPTGGRASVSHTVSVIDPL